jgi:hypothetical protein
MRGGRNLPLPLLLSCRGVIGTEEAGPLLKAGLPPTEPALLGPDYSLASTFSAAAVKEQE